MESGRCDSYSQFRQENSDSDETYGDPKPGLTDDEYLERRAQHFEKMLPGNPKPDQYQIEHTNIYDIHNRCADSFRVGRVLLL
jgi:hypothetical protein